MKYLASASVLLVAAGTAFAQQPASPDPQMQALTGQLVDEMQQLIQWRARAMSDEAQIAKLQDELAKLKKIDPPKK